MLNGRHWDTSFDNFMYFYSDEAFARRDADIKQQGKRITLLLGYFFVFAAQAVVLSVRHGGYVLVPAVLALGYLWFPVVPRAVFDWVDEEAPYDDRA